MKIEEPVVSVERTRRRRRPSGSAPPLPHDLGTSGRVWLIALAAVGIFGILAFAFEWARDVSDRVDSSFFDLVARLRTDWLTDATNAVDRIGSGWTLSFIAVAMIVALMVFKRWRHLFTLFGTIVVIEIVAGIVYSNFERPRPYGITILGRWAGYSLPGAPRDHPHDDGSRHHLHPRRRRPPAVRREGRRRRIAVATFAAAELYLAVYHPIDIVVRHHRRPSRSW